MACRCLDTAFLTRALASPQLYVTSLASMAVLTRPAALSVVAYLIVCGGQAFTMPSKFSKGAQASRILCKPPCIPYIADSASPCTQQQQSLPCNILSYWCDTCCASWTFQHRLKTLAYCCRRSVCDGSDVVWRGGEAVLSSTVGKTATVHRQAAGEVLRRSFAPHIHAGPALGVSVAPAECPLQPLLME